MSEASRTAGAAGSAGGSGFDELGGWPGVLGRLLSGSSLTAAEAETVLDEVLVGDAGAARTAAFLVALRAKGESIEEMTGLVRSMLAHAEPLVVEGDLIDIVGTGGDRLRSINVSTIAACIAAGAGARVCKHGNRAISSAVGTADVLEALGVAIDLGPDGVAQCIQEVGFAFCFAPRFHPAMRFVGPVRKELGVPTVFNFLGPLSNPAHARYQLVGVSDPQMASRMAGVLGANGSRRAMVVYADDGLDELSITSASTVLELTGDGTGEYEVRTWRLDPFELGFARADMQDLRGGDAAFNAGVIRSVLKGETGPRRDIAVLNAGAALVLDGHAADVAGGVELAAASVDSGAALAALEGLVATSTRAAATDEGAA